MWRGALLLLLLGPAAADARPEDPPSRTADEFFSGKVTSFKARRITLSYDLAEPSAFADFTVENPFNQPTAGGFWVKDGELLGRGVAAYVHAGVFEADVGVSLTLASKTVQDVGVLLMEPGVTGRFLLFGLSDTFLSKMDGQPVNQHMITMHGVRTDGSEGETVFRYLKRSRKPELEKGKPIEVEVRKRGERNRFTFAKTQMDAEDRYEKLTEFQPALYVLHSEMRVSKLTITGKLTERWLRKMRIEFDPKEVDDQAVTEIKPPEGNIVPVPDEEDARPDRGGRRPPWRRGSEAMGLVRKIRDTGLSENERQEAADGLTRENVKLEELRALIECLYSSELTTRTLSIKVLKGITKKTLGYHPKAPKKARDKAIRNWFRFLMENREKFRGG